MRAKAQLSPSQPVAPLELPAQPSAPWGTRSPSKSAALFSLGADANEGYRQYMEDGSKVIDPFPLNGSDRGIWGYFAVYDGHGGRQAVDYVEAKLHDVVLQELRSQSSPSTAPAALRSSFEKVDGQLGMLGAWNNGTTATVVLTHRMPDSLTVHVANVGDSRAVVSNREGGVRRVSKEHKATDPDEVKRVLDEGGSVRRGRVGGQLSVSRALGDHHLKSSGVSCIPDVMTFDGTRERALIVASDGLWDVVSDEDACKILDGTIDSAAIEGGGPAAVAGRISEISAQKLVDKAKELGSTDNITVLVIVF